MIFPRLPNTAKKRLSMPRWPLILAVAAAHLLVLLALSRLWRTPAPSMPLPPAIRVTLASAPPPSPAPKRTTAPAPRRTRQPPPQPRPAVKPRPQWRARSAREIRQSITPARPPVREAPPAPTDPIDVAQMQERLRRAVPDQPQIAASAPARAGAPATTKAAYADLVRACLERHWRQPSRSEVNGREPRVTVRLGVRRSGQLTAKTIAAASGLPAMDASVTRMLADLDRLPPFPAEMRRDSLALDIVLQLTR